MALPKQHEDFPEWYQEVVKQAELAEPSFARGTMVIKPYGYAIWERIQRELDDRIKATGHENFYFPLLMPYTLLEKEAEHVEGFAPEVAVVTHAGGEKLGEPLAVRPTSEVIIWATYAKWLQSYRDLPFLYNQWANVVRWEMRSRLFLRTTEFLWQEGHTAHETAEEARAEAEKMLEVYADLVEQVIGMPVLRGRKSDSERFPGADDTLTIEALMRDGKALQAGTSHDLGQNFSKTYEVTFLGRDGSEQHPYATSWGLSTRVVGGLIMTHGDDQGLRLPPNLAPVQVVIVPIYRSDEERVKVLAEISKLTDKLSGVRIKVDDRDAHRPGYKFAEWELKGVPVRIEIGPRDIESGSVPVACRDTGDKASHALKDLPKVVPQLLTDIQKNLYTQAQQRLAEHTHRPSNYNEMKELLESNPGFMLTGWCTNDACEAKVKKETTATLRCLPFDQSDKPDTCIVCDKPADALAAWAKAY